jgi:hypothetical protein
MIAMTRKGRRVFASLEGVGQPDGPGEMQMNSACALRLLAWVSILLGATLPGQARTQQVLENWQCTIDLTAAGIEVPPGVTATQLITTLTSKQCPGSTNKSLSIHCQTEEPVEGWSGGAQSVADFECQIFRPVCDLPPPAFVTTTRSKMLCDAAGVCTLDCSADPD